MIKLVLASILLVGFTSCYKSKNGGSSGNNVTPIVVSPPLPNVPVSPPVIVPTNSGPNSVDLDSAENYTILTKAGISNATGSHITGNLGVSPAAGSYITGFALTMDSSNRFSTSSSVTGNVYAANYSPPTPGKLTSAVNNMEAAYIDAAGRPNPNHVELGAGNIGGMTLSPGLYKWSSSVIIPVDVVLSGGPNDVFILQIAGTLTTAAAKNVILTGGVQAKNVFWVVAGKVTVEPNAHFEGVVLGKTAVVLQTNASLTGRILAQTAVTLDNNVVTDQ